MKQRKVKTESRVFYKETVLAGGGENDLRGRSGRVVRVLKRVVAANTTTTAGSNSNGTCRKRT